MKINGNAIKPGNVISHNGRIWVTTKTSHVKPGKGGAFAQVELRDIRDGTKLNERFRATESVERVILDEIECSYLYNEGETHIFMHLETFEPISATLPDNTTVTIIEADAVVKGQTASSSYKPAIADNGVRIMVPPFIETGTKIVVKIEDSTYIERAKD